MLTNKQLRKTLDELDWLKKYYNKHFAVKKKKFTGKYDKRLRSELRAVVKQIQEDVDKAAESVIVEEKVGRPPKDRVLLTKLHLFQVLFNFTNRQIEDFSLVFLLNNGSTCFSYKTIERAYSDEVVAMILHNLFILSAGKPRKVKASGDGTGISLTISTHYRTIREKDLKKEKDTNKRKEFVYNVAILDLDTNLYIGYASGFKSEQALFKQALKMARKAGFEIEDIRLDKLYSFQSIFDFFDKETKVIVIPKKNATIRGPKEWKELIRKLIEDTMAFFRDYHKRSNSESNFSRDKRRHGKVRQKLKERIITAAFTRAILHNFSMKHLYG